jgi:hypothetical protein
MLQISMVVAPENPPEPCASVVVFSFVGHATIYFLAFWLSSARKGKATP